MTKQGLRLIAPACLAILLVLSGCAAPTPTPLPPMATRMEDLVGIWTARFGGEPAYMQYKVDGTFILAKSIADLANNPITSGKVWFEGSTFYARDPLCDGDGAYHVLLDKENGAPVLKFQWVKDLCRERTRDLKWAMRKVEP